MTTSEETIREARSWVADALDEEIHYASPIIDRVVSTLAERGLLRQEMTEQKLAEWKQNGKKFEAVRLVTAVETREVPDGK